MIKYIKWILLLILISFLVFLSIKFINYNSFKIEDICEQNWIRKGFSLYNIDGELVASNDFIVEDYYIFFSDNEVSFCEKLNNNKCNKYSYNYKYGKITINGDDDFLYNGTYDLKYENDVLELSTIEEDGTKMIYYFAHLLG